MMARQHVAAQPMCSDLATAQAWRSPCTDVVAKSLAVRGLGILVFGSYHSGGLVSAIFYHAMKLTKGGKLPFVLMSDFNAHPDRVASTEWMERLGFQVITPGEPVRAAAVGQAGSRAPVAAEAPGRRAQRLPAAVAAAKALAPAWAADGAAVRATSGAQAGQQGLIQHFGRGRAAVKLQRQGRRAVCLTLPWDDLEPLGEGLGWPWR